jgi:outer membrane protein
MSASKFKTALATLVFFALVISVPVFAQQAPKTGVINSQRAFEISVEGKKASARVLERTTKIRADIAKMDNEIKQLETRISTQRTTMPADALLQAQSDLDRKTTARKRYEEDATRDVQKLQYDLIQKIRSEMAGLVETVAKEKGYDLILDLGSSGVVFFNKALDITDDVIKRYDETKAAAPAQK